MQFANLIASFREKDSLFEELIHDVVVGDAQSGGAVDEDQQDLEGSCFVFVEESSEFAGRSV